MNCNVQIKQQLLTESSETCNASSATSLLTDDDAGRDVHTALSSLSYSSSDGGHAHNAAAREFTATPVVDDVLIRRRVYTFSLSHDFTESSGKETNL
jgi:hypothetical protein